MTTTSPFFRAEPGSKKTGPATPPGRYNTVFGFQFSAKNKSNIRWLLFGLVAVEGENGKLLPKP
jgi:hypothetical protein